MKSWFDKLPDDHLNRSRRLSLKGKRRKGRAFTILRTVPRPEYAFPPSIGDAKRYLAKATSRIQMAYGENDALHTGDHEWISIQYILESI